MSPELIEETDSLSLTSQVRHYIKTCVPIFAPVELLSEFRVHYGRGKGIGFAFVVRLVKDDDAYDTAQRLHEAQGAIGVILNNVPAPWEIESLHFPANSTEPFCSVRMSMSESPSGHKQVRCVYDGVGS